MRKFVTILSVLACTWCVSETANAQIGTDQPPNCPGRLIIDGQDATTIYVHCECPDGSRAPDDQNGNFYCLPPQAQTIYQPPAQTDPAQDMINQMLGNAASQFGSQIGDALGRRVTKRW